MWAGGHYIRQMLVLVPSATVADKWVIGSSFEGKGSPTINKHSGYPQSV